MHYRLAYFVLIVSLFASFGCDRATVYISHPLVFTRERLVMSRQKEVQFLNDQLNKEVSTGFQGAIDTRSLTAFQNSFTGAFAPTTLPTTRPSDNGLLDLTKQVMAAPTTQAVASNVTLSSVNHFRDQLAYRDAVNAVIREKELDDTHDLHGKTLYTLKFDSAILPGTHSGDPVIVLLALKPVQMTRQQVEQLYTKWIELMEQHLRQEELNLQIRLKSNKLEPEDLLTVQLYLFQGTQHFAEYIPSVMRMNTKQHEDFDTWVKTVTEDTAQFLLAPADQQATILRDNSSDGRDKIVRIFTGFNLSQDARYHESFKGLLTVDYTLPGGVGGQKHATMSKVNRVSDLSGFEQLIRGIESFSKQTVYVDSIDPQEYVQNLSDVATKNDLLNLSMAISAILGNTTNIGNTAQFLQQSQTLLQAIRRNPVAIGFSAGSQFGWLLGSPFQIDKKRNATFTHVPGRQSFAVSIVAPISTGAVTLTATAYWLNSRGELKSGVEIQGIGSEVLLPTDAKALLTYSLREKFQSGVPGRPVLIRNHIPWTLQAGVDGQQDQNLLIQGDDLWRNPSVFVDSQQADAVDTLPDMKGIIAHFKHKLVPVNSSDNLATLTVVTSVSPSDSIAQSVTVLPPPQAQPMGPSASLATTFVVGGVSAQSLNFTVDPKNIPASFSDYILTVRPTAGTETTVIDTGTAKLTADGKILSFSIPAGVKGTANSPVLLAIDFRQRLNPFNDPVNLLAKLDPADRTVIYFPKPDQDKPKLEAPVAVSVDKTSGSCTPNNIVLKPASDVKRTDLYLAYAGLQSSINKKTATLSIKQVGKDMLELPLSEDPGSDNFLVTLNPRPSTLVDGTYTPITIRYTNKAGVTASIEVAGGNSITVTTK